MLPILLQHMGLAINLFRLAQDPTIAPASQVYYGHISSICAELTAGRRNPLTDTVHEALS